MREGRHIRLYHTITGCEAWRHLSGNAIKVLISLARFNDGESNGRILFGERTGAAETGLSRNTVRRALKELIDKGFIAVTKPGAFNRNGLQAATFRLTWVAWPGGSPSAPTRDFEKWKHGNSQAQSLTETGAEIDPPKETEPETGSEIDPPELEKRLVSNNRPMSRIEPQVSDQGQRQSPLGKKHRKQPQSMDRPETVDLRRRLLAYLDSRPAGEQTWLAERIGCPGGTLSKFKSGASLPPKHAAALDLALPTIQQITEARRATG